MQTTKLTEIDQHTIECDLRKFTHWLNDIVDQVNYLTNVFEATKALAENNEIRINALEGRMDDVEDRLDSLEDRMDAAEEAIRDLTGGGGTLSELIDMINGRVDLLYGWLPVPYGTIDSKGWKFAMGNISVMSDQNAPTNVEGPGIYTSGQVEDNDVTFN